MPDSNTAHEVLTVVFQVRHFDEHERAGRRSDAGHSAPELAVLLWQRALDPQRGAWSLPGGALGPTEDLTTSARRQLAEKVDVRELHHLEQLSVFSDPVRVPGTRTIASTYLGLVPVTSDPRIPDDTAWHPVAELPDMAFDHRVMIEHARARLAAKLSYTNIAFALAPDGFTMSELRDIYCAALGYQVDTTNLQRVLTRRGVIGSTGETARSGPGGGRPAAVHRFIDHALRVTDEFAALRPPN
ncbi:NUDIX domain-containing protein [Rhodococcus sp. HNM0569]|uniref:NUDIX hydrolase n=1 Tax=Rhodococcus sp. HNM0569 TaxID=2716340 RepID=UPI00146F52CB|nr:NUDIX domain-containing protein [Rhodococcus sp. HNM0569]NLU82962.1 NUDIX hydrolase [Rhodococcus sp. HNM0569]